MKRLILLFFLFTLMAGCNSKSTSTEISIKNAKKEVQVFISDVESKNGAHLFINGQKEAYVYLNGKNVTQGEKAVYFTNFNVVADGSTLNIQYDKNETRDYSNKELKHAALYKVNKDKKYKYIKLFCNGEESSFHTVSGKN